jgi:hypothetical protein
MLATPDAPPGSDEKPPLHRTRMTSAAKSSILDMYTKFLLRSRHGFLGRDLSQAISLRSKLIGTRGRPVTSRRFRLLGLSGEPSSQVPTATPPGVSTFSIQARKRIFPSASARQMLRCASDFKSPGDTTRRNDSTNESHFGTYAMSRSLPTLTGRMTPRTSAHNIADGTAFGPVRNGSSRAGARSSRSPTNWIRGTPLIFTRPATRDDEAIVSTGSRLPES